MSTNAIVEKILADAQAEATAIIEDAERKASETLADANATAQTQRKATEDEVAKKTQSIFRKKEADARLESAKIHLLEKRKAVDSVYALALGELIALSKEDTLTLSKTLLEKYAEEGDELFFAENFKYADEVSVLPVIKTRNITVSSQRLPLDGGMKLVGKVADKDLSYGALLATDKDLYQAKLAKELFN